MEIQEYAALFLRRIWLIVFSFLFILLGASVYCVVTPELYKSSTTILIIPQSVPQDYVRSTTSIKVEEQLATIKQMVLSRTTLMRVMDELGLFQKERKNLAAEEVVEMMRKRIEIDVVQGKRRESVDAFSLSVMLESRQSAMSATSRLASFFIDENLKNRELQAVGTSEFLESQLKDTKVRLEAQEAKVKEYKMRYMGELPQQTEANLRMLTGLQERLRTNADSTRNLEDRKVFMEAQIGLLEKSMQTVVSDNGAVEQVAFQDPAQLLINELAAKKTRLGDLSARYTEVYPEVLRTKQEIAELEKRILEMRKGAPIPAPTNGKSKEPAPASTVRNPLMAEELRRMRTQVEAANVEIASLKRDREEIRKGVAAVEQKIERAPRREQEMISLLRDYDNSKRSYDDLLKKKLEADVAQNLEKRQKGTQFQILDPANLPEDPFKPDRKKVMGIALLIAVALGFGGTIGLEMIDPTLRGVSDFKHFFQVPVLACIPVVQDQRYKRAKALRRAAVLGGIVTFTTVLSFFLLAYSEKIRNILKF